MGMQLSGTLAYGASRRSDLYLAATDPPLLLVASFPTNNELVVGPVLFAIELRPMKMELGMPLPSL